MEERLGGEEVKRLEAFEMWCWRRILRIKWTDKKTNEKVLEEIEEPRTLIKTLKIRRERWIGHVLRHESLTGRIIEGMMEGTRPRGRPMRNYVKQLKESTGVDSYQEIKANDREEWRTLLHQLSVED